jgi:hypothetical protein
MVAEAELLGKGRAAFAVAWRGEGVGALQTPAGAVVVRRKTVCAGEVAAEYLAAPAAVETDDEVSSIGSVDRDYGFRWRCLRRLPESSKGSVNGRDEVWEFA